MASVAPAPVARSAPVADNPPRIVLHNIPWELYERLRAERSNWGIRMAYDRGKLELMSPSQRHEEIGSRFGLLLMSLADALDFKCKPLAHTTWTRPELEKGKEADACFYLANYERVRGKTIDLDVDPPPDLAVEVEISRSAINSLNIYAAIGVPEIWRFDGSTFHIHSRRADGGYEEVERSPALPFVRPEEIVRWLIDGEALDDDVEWMRRVREWARAELAPRLNRA